MAAIINHHDDQLRVNIGILYKLKEHIDGEMKASWVAHQLNKLIKYEAQGYPILNKDLKPEIYDGINIDLDVNQLLIQVPIGIPMPFGGEYMDILIMRDRSLTAEIIIKEVIKFYNSLIDHKTAKILKTRQYNINSPQLVDEVIRYVQLLADNTFMKNFEITTPPHGEAPVNNNDYPILRLNVGP